MIYRLKVILIVFILISSHNYFHAESLTLQSTLPKIDTFTTSPIVVTNSNTKFYKFTTIDAAASSALAKLAASEGNEKLATTTSALKIANKLYCDPILCRVYNGGGKLVELPHIGCQNNGTFEMACGSNPRLVYMNERRRNLILDMHNLARSHIASGQLAEYKPAAHMPLLKWDNELEFLAALHVKRCRTSHDQCRNTPVYSYSGQNIAYHWSSRNFRSHSRRFKTFIIDWFREHKDANQTFIDSYRPHPEKKKIGHFTLMVSDRVHRVGCAAVRFQNEKNVNNLILTCNYDYNNILNEPIYQSGPAASKCAHRESEKFPGLCDWNDDDLYDYDSSESLETGNKIDDSISFD